MGLNMISFRYNIHPQEEIAKKQKGYKAKIRKQSSDARSEKRTKRYLQVHYKVLDIMSIDAKRLDQWTILNPVPLVLLSNWKLDIATTT